MASQENSRIILPPRALADYNNVGIPTSQIQHVEGLRLCLGRDIENRAGDNTKFTVPTTRAMAQAFIRAGGIRELRAAVMQTAEILDNDPLANPGDTLLSVTYQQMTDARRGISPPELRWVDEIGRITEDNPPL